MNNSVKHKVTVVGLGHCGGRIVEELAGFSNSSDLNIAAIDTDERDLNKLSRVVQMPVGRARKKGLSCGGNVEDGAVVVASDGLKRIKAFTKDSDVVLVVAGLGKGFASGGVLSLAQMLRDFCIPAVYFITMPLSIEGNHCQKKADKALAKLKELSRTIIPVSLDSLYTFLPAEAGINEALRTADQVMGKGLAALIEIFTGGSGDILSIDFTAVLDVLKNHSTSCSIAFAETDDKNYNGLVQNFMECPISGGERSFANADAMICKVSGPPATPVNELKFCLDKLLERIGDSVSVTSAVNTSFDEDCVRLSGLVINHTGKKKEKVDKADAPHGLFQAELELVVYTSGRFTGTTRIHSKKDGQDLDIPTFQRQNVVIEKGDES